jgi:hypothetical protein
MLPGLAILSIGRGRRGRIRWPIPLLLLWPLVGLAWLVLGIALVERKLSRRPPHPGLGALSAALDFFGQLSGLKIDVRSSKGERVLVRLI